MIQSVESIRENRRQPLAIFCDFDGTFIEDDIGRGLAIRHLADKRDALHARLAAGEFDAWSYAEALFTGFALNETDRLAFLDSIALDPGAASLVRSCRDHDHRFTILSDGFDLNIEHLRRRFGLDFPFRANSLRVGPAGWQVAPGGRNPACACGTGLCKRAQLEDHRAAHPEALIVHVGNGRVSDFCGAIEADVAFAKETLAEALDEVGREYHAFETLNDVVTILEDEWG